jgi:peptidoglycan/xylan/chitin deacetylase (PgdA/CDA1 family)
VLAGILSAEGRGDALASVARRMAPPLLRSRVPNGVHIVRWLKQNYRPTWTDHVVQAGYLEHHDHLPTELFLSEAQIRDLIDEGWDIGNHTWSHARLACLSEAEVAGELERNESWLGQLTGGPVHWVSYPYGFTNDVGPAAIRWVEERSNHVGIMARGGINLTLDRPMLARIPVGDEDLTAFRRRLLHSVLVSQYERFRTVVSSG